MTSQKDQIQLLIQEIDTVLQKPGARLPWVASGQVAQQRQVLQRIRNYLTKQQSLTQLYPKPVEDLNSPESDVQKVMQSVIQEMQELRSQLLRPLQSEVATLTQQRSALIREIRKLEAYKQSYQLEHLNQSPTLSGESVQQVHDRADQVLTSLDATLQVVFASLQQDIQAYQTSLSQGLDKLHGLGQQGEIMFTTLINRFAEQLGQEASSHQVSSEFLETELPNSVLEPVVPLQAELAEAKAFDPKKISLPYPGTEIPIAAPEPFQDANQNNAINLSELLNQLAIDASNAPTVVSVTPPAINPEAATDLPASMPSLVEPAAASEPMFSTLVETTYSSEESLLPVSVPQPIDLQLDETVRDQLSQDLSILEKRVSEDTPQSSPSGSPMLEPRSASALTENSEPVADAAIQDDLEK